MRLAAALTRIIAELGYATYCRRWHEQQAREAEINAREGTRDDW